MSSPAAEPRFADVEALVRRAVARVAATDPHPADPYRGLYVSDEQAIALAGATATHPPDARLADAVALLGLGEADATLLALCAAPELDPRFGRLFGYLHDDVTRRLPSPRLLAWLLAEGDAGGQDAVLARLGADAPLRRSGALRLLDADPQTPVADRALQLDGHLVAHLLGVRLGEDAAARRIAAPGEPPGRDAVVAELRGVLGGVAAPELPVVVAGPDAAELLAAALGRDVLLADVHEALAPGGFARGRLHATLAGAAAAWGGLESLSGEDRAALPARVRSAPEPPVLCARSRDAVRALDDLPVVVIEAPLPDFAERRSAWARLTGVADPSDAAAKFRLSLGQVAHAAQVARLAAAARGEPPTPADLDRGARQASSGRLGELATHVPTGPGWEDLVLPAAPLAVLRSVSAYLRHRDLVLSEWGYGRSIAHAGGLKVLFAGESGTGKTLSAQVLAGDLGLDLHRIDLAGVVSKYIGETEKNLDRIFDAAEGSNAILLFDEADALFGKRSAVKDAHDRYANLEVAYLLQKMEQHGGAVVLATNLRRNLDDAFLRRLDFVVEFPVPEEEDRRRIWRRLLPERAPIADDLDLDLLAARFRLAGGNIRNCSLAAAFLAADDGGTITMAHLLRAVDLELEKLGRLRLAATPTT